MEQINGKIIGQNEGPTDIWVRSSSSMGLVFVAVIGIGLSIGFVIYRRKK